MRKGACHGCKYMNKLYKNKDRNGNRTVSGDWCVQRNGRIKNQPKECKMREEKT